jgi:hypothetical protein
MNDSGFEPYFYKRLSYQHENELRVAIWHHDGFIEGGDFEFTKRMEIETLPKQPAGLDVDVDVNTLVRQIYTSPNSPLWFRDTVASIVNNRYELEAEVVTSEVDSRPNYG